MRARILRMLVAVVGMVIVLGAFLLVRSVMVESRQITVEPPRFEAPDSAAERLARAVRLTTISHDDRSEMDMAAFSELHELLVSEYPGANDAMEREVVEPCSVVYTWKGSDDSLEPALMVAHLDVVPVEEHEIEQWTHPPFSGAVADGWIWGRGTLDDKTSAMALMEAVELLVREDVRPKRTVVLAFGCDEEVGGGQGAEKIAARFAERGMQFAFALDEGLAVTDGYFPGVDRPVALIGIVERGYVTFTLTVEMEGGHSSMPPHETSIGVLSQAIARLEDNPMPTGLNPATRALFETMAPEVSFPQSVVMSNLWLLEPVVVSQMAKQPSTNASVRTTTAVTMFDAGVQENVLAKKAVAQVNFRLVPGDSIEDVRRHIVDTIDDQRVEVEQRKSSGFGSPASEISEVDTFGYRAVQESIGATFGQNVIVAPSMTLGGTDVRHYQDVSDDQYRFAPLVMRKENRDTERVHGIDERISVENYRRAVVFYAELLARM